MEGRLAKSVSLKEPLYRLAHGGFCLGCISGGQGKGAGGGGRGIEVGDGNRDRIVLESSFNCLHYKGSNVEHTWSRASTVGEQMERPQLPIYLIVQ